MERQRKGGLATLLCTAIPVAAYVSDRVSGQPDGNLPPPQKVVTFTTCVYLCGFGRCTTRAVSEDGQIYTLKTYAHQVPGCINDI